MRIVKKKLIKSIKNKLVKRVILLNFFVESEYLVYELRLENFWNIKRNIEAYCVNNGISQTIPLMINKNNLKIKMPIACLSSTEPKNTIKLFNNRKKMWIKTSKNFVGNNEGIIIKNNYFKTIIKKDIIIRNNNREFEFDSQKVYVNDICTTYNSFGFVIDDSSCLVEKEKELEVYAFNKNKTRTIAANYKQSTGRVVLKDLTLFSKGIWRLFILINGQLHSLCLKENTKNTFETCGHNVDIINSNNGLYLLFRPHILRHELVSINLTENKEVEIKMVAAGNQVAENYIFVIDNVKADKEIYKKMIPNSNHLIVTIPLAELYEEIAVKRFFVIESGDLPKKYQFDLNTSEQMESIVSFQQILDSQLITFSFYKRKDASLGLKIKRPKIKRMITGIEDFKLTGYIGSLDNFPNCQAYLLIEDRYSMESIKIPITGDFTMDLKQHNLADLKSKGKTILDLFVIIQSQEKEIVRKEKLKYKYADYKKDNYYDYVVVHDLKLNQHHFLITTTPFGNMKIESFTIPNYIEVPEDTSQKNENIWLIGERYQTAQDNGFIFFNWLQENTSIAAYYVIESDAPDYEKVKDCFNVIAFGSQKHFDIAFKAKVLIGTHDLENILPYKPAKGFFHYEDTYKVFLQHGVLGRKNVEYHKKYYENPFHLFIVSSDPEKYDVVMKELGYEAEEVAVTGLARFDKLIQNSKPKDILLMPTWRDWINTDEKFLASKYYAAYSNLIKNPILLQLLEKHDVKLYFYPHYRAQNYFKDIDGLHERIKFIPLGTKTVQQLLIDHALLITDYSSVSFDFTLMQKPVIYYHFDVERFFQRGILRPIMETFIGGIGHSEEEIVQLMKDRIKSGFENYDLDISDIIKYNDQSNCLRIYETVQSNLNSKIKAEQD